LFERDRERLADLLSCKNILVVLSKAATTIESHLNFFTALVHRLTILNLMGGCGTSKSSRKSSRMDNNSIGTKPKTSTNQESG